MATRPHFSVGVAQVGDEGNLKVHVLGWDPDPLVIGNNDFTVRVTDTDDVALDATFDNVETWQRVHDHGSPIEPTVTAGGSVGEFEIEDMNIIHRGSWLFRFEPNAAGVTDRIEFNFAVACLPDP